MKNFLDCRPAEMLVYRGECFRDSKPEDIYRMYSESSELVRMFPDSGLYVEHFNEMSFDRKFVKINIVKESVKGGLAEVKYIEYFSEGGAELAFYSKSIFRLTGGAWLIVKEKREIVPVGK